MKYTINGFSQEKLIKYGLDLKDTILLRYFIDFRDTASMSTLIVDGKPYYWIKYEHLKEDLPILEIKNNDTLRRRLKKLEEAGILGHYHKLKGGSYSYYCIGENYSDLITSEEDKDFNTITPPTQKSYPSDSKVVPPPTQKSEQNNPSTKIYIKKEKEKKEKSSLDGLINNYTKNNDLIETLKDFLKMRKAIKKPATDRAMRSILKKLDSLTTNDNEKIAILEQSILNCWQSIFPLKEEFKNPPKRENKENKHYEVILKEDM